MKTNYRIFFQTKQPFVMIIKNNWTLNLILAMRNFFLASIDEKSDRRNRLIITR